MIGILLLYYEYIIIRYVLVVFISVKIIPIVHMKSRPTSLRALSSKFDVVARGVQQH